MEAHKTDKPSQIGRLLQYSREDTTNTYQDINFGNVPNFQAQNINQETGVKVNGAMKILSSHAVIHIFGTHGDDSKERPRGQKGVVDADFELIPLIFSDYDAVKYGGKNSNGKDSIIFIKEINRHRYHLVAAASVRQGEINLYVNTLYIKLPTQAKSNEKKPAQ